jgi:hypothetical protein
MTLSKAYKATKIIEAIENYSLFEINKLKESKSTRKKRNDWYYSDHEFWKKVISTPENFWNRKMNFSQFTLCDWVSRVPGLYWTKYSEEIRRHSKKDIARQSRQWIELKPFGKSKKVVGGIGTLLLSPNDEGKRLMSVSSSCNASVGIPVLISPNVFDSLKLEKGDVINIMNATWQPMDSHWSVRFASTQNIPKGYLIIDSPEKVSIIKKDMPFAFQPFSIMEYQKDDALLYDFVYLGVDNKLKNLNSVIQKFFNYYAKKEDRHGTYLLNPNMIQPLFETQYTTPSEMQSPSEKAKLQLIYKRIRKQEFKKTTLDKLIETLPHFYDSSIAIRRLAKTVGVSSAMFQEDNAASMSAQLINYCFETNKIEELTDRMIVEYPQIFYRK